MIWRSSSFKRIYCISLIHLYYTWFIFGMQGLMEVCMAIPNFDTNGVLPYGIYSAKLDDIRERFCSYGNIELREKLFKTFEKYLKEILKHKVELEVYVDGSFVTDKSEPGDIDILLFYDVEYYTSNWGTLLNDDYIKIHYKGVQVLSASLYSDSKDMTLDFAHDCEERPDVRKGLVRVEL